MILEQNILSLFTRMIPEAFLVIYAICKLTNTNVDMKKILLSSVIGGVGVYVTRLLPVHFGVHTILCIMLYIVLAVMLNGVEIYKAISTTLVSQIILFICDFILFVFYTDILQLSSKVVFGQTWVSDIAGIPPLILFYLIIRVIFFLKEKRKVHD